MRFLLFLALIVPCYASVLTDQNGDGKVSVVCVGDSNTTDNLATRNWCERLSDSLHALNTNWSAFQSSFGGATASDLWCSNCGSVYLELADACPVSVCSAPTPDIVIIALGTDDLGAHAQAYWQTLDALHKLRSLALATTPVVFVTTIPATYSPTANDNAAIDAVNIRIRTTWPDRYIEFHDGFDQTDYLSDGTHLNDVGQALRAANALSTLQGAQ